MTGIIEWEQGDINISVTAAGLRCAQLLRAAYAAVIQRAVSRPCAGQHRAKAVVGGG